MIPTILEMFKQPLVQKGLWTLGLLIVLVVAVIFSRRMIQKLKVEDDKKQPFKKWISILLIFIYGMVLVRVWANTDLFAYLKHPIFDKLLRSGITLGIIYLIIYFVRRFINSLKISIAKQHDYRKRATYAGTFVYIIALIPIWAGSTQQWATVLSVMGAGIALALHEVLLNMAGWVYIIFRRPYKTGDRIELGGIKGDVIDISLFQTALLEIGNWVDGDQSTGRVIHLPHGQIFRNPLFNYTKGFEFIWNERSVLLTFESNWEKAKNMMQEMGEELSNEIQQKVQNKIKRMAREYLIYYGTFTPIVYTRIEESGIKLTLRYLTEAKKRRTSEDLISQKTLKAIHESPDIDFAYPTLRVTGHGKD